MPWCCFHYFALLVPPRTPLRSMQKSNVQKCWTPDSWLLKSFSHCHFIKFPRWTVNFPSLQDFSKQNSSHDQNEKKKKTMAEIFLGYYTHCVVLLIWQREHLSCLSWAWPQKATTNSKQMPEIGHFKLLFCNSNRAGWQLHSLTVRLRRPPCILINRARIIFPSCPCLLSKKEIYISGVKPTSNLFNCFRNQRQLHLMEVTCLH